MIDIVSLVPSKDMRAEIRRKTRQFSDMEKAAILSMLNLPEPQERELLQELADTTNDETVRVQLDHFLKRSQFVIDRFKEAADEAIFGVRIHATVGPFIGIPQNELIDGYFSNFNEAYQFGCSMGRSMNSIFWIYKRRIFQELAESDDVYACDRGFLGEMRFNAKGELEAWSVKNALFEKKGMVSHDLLATGREWEEDHGPSYFYFTHRWVDLPNPFERGDLVRILDDSLSVLDEIPRTQGIAWAMVVEDHEDWESRICGTCAWLRDAEKKGKGEELLRSYSIDNEANNLRVLIAYEDGRFEDAMINPLFLERMEAKFDEDTVKQQEIARQIIGLNDDLGLLMHMVLGQDIQCPPMRFYF